jgi:hypothetical protein
MAGMNKNSTKISGPRPLPYTFFSVLHSTIRRFIVWTNEEQRGMEADYSGGQSSPWAVASRRKNEVSIIIITWRVTTHYWIQLWFTIKATFLNIKDIFNDNMSDCLSDLHANMQWYSETVYCYFLLTQSYPSSDSFLRCWLAFEIEADELP